MAQDRVHIPLSLSDGLPPLYSHRRLASERQASTSTAASWPRFHFVKGDEELLPLKERSVDAVVSCLGLHWVNDLPVSMMALFERNTVGSCPSLPSSASAVSGTRRAR